MTSRHVVPWIGSAAFHAALFLVPLGLALAPQEERLRENRIDIDFPTGVSSTPVRRSEIDLPKGATEISRPGSDMDGLPLLPSLAQTAVTPIRDISQGVPGPVGSADFAQFPSAEEVLADNPAGVEVPRETRETEDMPVRPAARIGWEGSSRTLIRARDPEFPSVLSASGQEVECEARITVAPGGNVVRVEISRSSGYTEIDASVEAALRDYLFSRVDGRSNSVGTVKFRFRLEKRD